MPVSELSDFQTAEAIRDGALPSPTKYGDFWLFDLRITGTGAAYRGSLGEWAIRDPNTWLSDDFVNRCNGLAVIDGHPDRAGLNHDEFRERAIGSIVLPYRKDDEVRGVAKIFDADAALMMQTTHRSTSPGVMPQKGNDPVELEGGAKVLAEDLPLILDHLAICEAGVWDKDGPPDGIRLDRVAGIQDSLLRKDGTMADEDVEKIKQERDDARARADTAERELADAKTRHDAEEKERTDKARKDAEEAEAAEKSKKADARKNRHDSGKHDGKFDDCSRCDAEENETEEERKAREAREDKAKKDAEEVIDPNREEIVADARRDSRIQGLERELATIRDGQKPLTIDDRNDVSAAFHRYDNLYQMLGDHTPQHMHGESPSAYRRRLADGLRKHTKTWKEQAIHDAVTGSAFDAIERCICDEALAEAKNPSNRDTAAVLREVRDTTTTPGRTITRFFGDARIAWEPFMPQMGVKITRFNKPQLQGEHA
jgi:hypothetical protein